jgi:hypothetical protein
MDKAETFFYPPNLTHIPLLSLKIFNCRANWYSIFEGIVVMAKRSGR